MPKAVDCELDRVFPAVNAMRALFLADVAAGFTEQAAVQRLGMVATLAVLDFNKMTPEAIDRFLTLHGT